jgi:hypothetical protein
MLTIYPSTVYADSTGALVVLTGPANRAVSWSLVGAGTLTPITDYTDDQGRAAAKFVPAGAGNVTIEATYGT